MNVLENKPDQLVIAFNKVNLVIYEHPDGDIVIYATKTVSPTEDIIIPVIPHSYEGVMGARVPARTIQQGETVCTPQ